MWRPVHCCDYYWHRSRSVQTLTSHYGTTNDEALGNDVTVHGAELRVKGLFTSGNVA